MADNELAHLLGQLLYQQRQAVRLQQETYVALLRGEERYADPDRLTRFEHQVFSQNGEDGVLQEIFRRIGIQDRVFVEIGVGNGMENNTAFLLQGGWKGFWLEGDKNNAAFIERVFDWYITRDRLRLLKRFAMVETIADDLRTGGIPTEFDFLSVDIDQNTYWVWHALPHLRPRVVVVEYNASYPPGVDWKVPYDPLRTWDGSSDYGASLKAFELLGRKLGYHLVHCEMTGTNAFFVREDLVGDRFLGPYVAEHHYEPPRYFLLRMPGHWTGERSFTHHTPTPIPGLPDEAPS